MVWSIFWFLFGLFLSGVLLVAVVGLFAKSARLVRLPLLQGLGDKRKAWREAVEVAGTGACVSLFVQHPRVVLVLRGPKRMKWPIRSSWRASTRSCPSQNASSRAGQESCGVGVGQVRRLRADPRASRTGDSRSAIG